MKRKKAPFASDRAVTLIIILAVLAVFAFAWDFIWDEKQQQDEETWNANVQIWDDDYLWNEIAKFDSLGIREVRITPGGIMVYGDGRIEFFNRLGYGKGWSLAPGDSISLRVPILPNGNGAPIDTTGNLNRDPIDLDSRRSL